MQSACDGGGSRVGADVGDIGDWCRVLVIVVEVGIVQVLVVLEILVIDEECL